MLSPCCSVGLASRPAGRLAQRKGSLDPAAPQRTSSNKTAADRTSLPSYKSRRSFGLSSVFPSVSRHVGPNPDAEIIRADAAAEFREGDPAAAAPVYQHGQAGRSDRMNFRSGAFKIMEVARSCVAAKTRLQ